jgi:glycosyltransferase involved in cell wall biosynthesis
MIVLQIMGCTSDQYGSMERYLVAKARALRGRGGHLKVVYENFPSSDRFIGELTNAGGELCHMKMRSTRDYRYLRNIRKLIKRELIDIVHVYFAPTSHSVSIFLWLRGFRNIVRTAPNLPAAFRRGGSKSRFLSARYHAFRHRFLARFVRKIVCRSAAVQRELAILGVPSKKLTVVSGGTDAERYRHSPETRMRTRHELEIPESALVIGVFSRLVGIKRIDLLIKDFSYVKDRRPDCRLLVAGDGPELGALRDLAEDLSLNSSITFLGRQEDLSDLYSALDVYCSASLAEGMSNSILEAMSTELPVIASDIPPNRELIEENQGGYLIDFDRPDEFASRICRILDRETRKKMGAHNRNRVIQNYSLQARVEGELAVYAEMLS